jgi:hypothetical protein
VEARDGYWVVIWIALGSWTLVPIVKGVAVAFRSVSRCAMVASLEDGVDREIRATTGIL